MRDVYRIIKGRVGGHGLALAGRGGLLRGARGGLRAGLVRSYQCCGVSAATLRLFTHIE